MSLSLLQMVTNRCNQHRPQSCSCLSWWDWYWWKVLGIDTWWEHLLCFGYLFHSGYHQDLDRLSSLRCQHPYSMEPQILLMTSWDRWFMIDESKTLYFAQLEEDLNDICTVPYLRPATLSQLSFSMWKILIIDKQDILINRRVDMCSTDTFSNAP